jgi:hypothetical protein
LDGYDYAVTGSPFGGPQLIKFVNKTDQPQDLAIFSSPAALSDEQFLGVLNMMGTGATPEPDSGLPTLEEVVEHTGSAITSQSTTTWVVVDLPAGNYTFTSFVADPYNQFTPHFIEGMIGHIAIG